MNRPALRALDEALPLLLAQVQSRLGAQHISTFEADGLVLVQDVVAALQVPPQDNSSMDGYAVRALDCAQADAVLRVTQRIPAGTHGTQLHSGEAARIFTGAPIPPGADAVVMQEDCDVLDGEQIRVLKPVPAGQWVRRSGEDVTRGATVLRQGTRLTLVGSDQLGKTNKYVRLIPRNNACLSHHADDVIAVHTSPLGSNAVLPL
jgi:molybdopterin molybdotransferase